MSDEEKIELRPPTGGMTVSTWQLHVALIRLVKGMVTAWEKWLSKQ